jgi:hypothetical protein
MASDQLYNTCMVATGDDKRYCMQVLNTLSKLSRERAVIYRGKRGVQHIVVLPYDDQPVVDIVADKDRSLIVKIKSMRYASLIRYAYDGKFKPTHAVISNLEIANMLNMHVSFEDVLREYLARRRGYEQ